MHQSSRLRPTSLSFRRSLASRIPPNFSAAVPTLLLRRGGSPPRMSESDRRWRNTIRGSLFQGFSGTKQLVQEIYFERKDFNPALSQACGGGSSTSEESMPK